MSRLAPLDKALVLILVPLWMVCFALGVKSQIEGRTLVYLGLSVPDAHGYPLLTGEYAPIYASDPLQAAGLRAGDRLLRLGREDLRGLGTLGLMARSAEMGTPGISVVYERNGERGTARIPGAPVSIFRAWLATSFAFAAAALFVMLRARPSPTIGAAFLSAIAYGIGLCVYTVSARTVYAWSVSYVVAQAFVIPLQLRFLLLFPDDRAPAGRWHRIWPWLFATQGLFQALMLWGCVRQANAAANAVIAVGAAASVAVMTHKYRQADPVARRQIKLVVFGLYCAAIPILVASGLLALDPRFGNLQLLSFWAAPIFPAFLVLSIVRFNLFDVDRVISAAASYNALLVLLGAGALVLVPRLAEAASGLVGLDPSTSQGALSLLLAGAVVPAHRRLRPQIDRLFFKERYALDHGIAEVLTGLSRCADARELTARVGEGLHGLLRPDACVVYAAIEESYAPVFVEGRAVPPGFEAASPLVATLNGRRAPLSLSDAGRRPDKAPLGPFDRAALETLQAEVVVPVLQDDALVAFLCLGPKRSGDIYTSTDLSLLAAVAEKVATELRRFDQEETVREAREMQESLRRYVPGAIAEQLGSGEELVSGEREVTVLFVDIRGYTSSSESRKAEEIFSTVNRYTETVSEMRTHGGSVVEFNGDGMMAVFGAPRDLAHKERAAVEAGREIVEAVAALPVEGGEALSVGVGIATGEAFVGNIQAVDRMIWSAIGNTTNLAARLQGLTRDLKAAVVIDSPTRKCAQAAAADFEKRPEVPIRGRRAIQDVYALLLRTDS